MADYGLDWARNQPVLPRPSASLPAASFVSQPSGRVSCVRYRSNISTSALIRFFLTTKS